MNKLTSLRSVKCRVLASAIFCAGMLSAGLPATAAAANESSDEWEFNADMYLWAAGMDIDTNGGPTVDISFGDIISNLDMTFMGGIGARKGNWSLLADIIYLDVGAKNGGSQTLPIGDPPITATVSVGVKTKALITSFGGGYSVVRNDKKVVEIVGGARYLDVELDTSVKSDVNDVPVGQRDFSASDDLWDGFIGIKGRTSLSEHWFLPYYADIGTGGSDLTWQMMAGVGYQYRWGDVLLTWRHLEFDFGSKKALKDLAVSGPLLGLNFRF